MSFAVISLAVMYVCIEAGHLTARLSLATQAAFLVFFFVSVFLKVFAYANRKCDSEAMRGLGPRPRITFLLPQERISHAP